MQRIVITALAGMCLMAVSCGGGESATGEAPAGAKVPALFRAVPSDALALVSGPHAAEVLSYFDSTSALHSIPLGDLADSRAVLSLSYYTSLVPVLTIQAGRADREPEAAVAMVQAAADSLGFQTAIRVLDGNRRQRGENAHQSEGSSSQSEGDLRHAVRILTICPSATVLQTVLRHIDEGASIADVPLFQDACASVRNSADCIIVRPSAAARLLPRTFLSGLFPRAAALGFASSTAAWITFSGRDGAFDLDAVSAGDGRSFVDFLDELEPAECRIGKVLPESTTFVLDYPVSSIKAQRSAIEKYRDANISLDKYRASLKAVGKVSGKNPLDWERELDIKEIALVKTDSATVLLVRPCRKPKLPSLAAGMETSSSGRNPSTDGSDTPRLQANPDAKFCAALYGSVFDIDDSCVAVWGRWLVYGSEDDVRNFIRNASQNAGRNAGRNASRNAGRANASRNASRTNAVRTAAGSSRRAGENFPDCRIMCMTADWTIVSTAAGNKIEFR